MRIDDDGAGPLIEGNIAATSASLNMALVTEMELVEGTDTGIAALRTGGLVNVSFGANNALNVTQINEGAAMQNARASDIVTATHNGQTYAFVSFGSEDTVSMYRQLANGQMQHIADAQAEHGLWADTPGALTVASAADGGLYVVVAGSGSGSLSVLAVATNGSTMIPVDHVVDSLDTRFANATEVTSVSISGQDYVLAAGSDAGLSLFVMLPGGRLQHVETFEGTIDAPLNGITALEAMAVPGGIRVWASTEAAPFLSEFSVSLQNIGINRVDGGGNGTLNGTNGDDILDGGAGHDNISGGGGSDILLDGAGLDTLRGGNGADTFILSRDGQRDVIQDFQHTLDQIDLSGFGPIGGIGSLSIVSRTWGAEIRFGNEVIEVRSANGASLSAQNFNAENLVLGGRIEVDPSLYPAPGTYVPEVNPAPLPPAPSPRPHRRHNPCPIRNHPPPRSHSRPPAPPADPPAAGRWTPRCRG
ncbi:hypothetical protein [Sulfitobacter aestuariivivens]|uniref:hypothetical protein n=1 Tax=Sulfitobacter aestuariivivens TaxID=2766981 RepID=UPI00360D5368